MSTLLSVKDLLTQTTDEESRTVVGGIVRLLSGVLLTLFLMGCETHAPESALDQDEPGSLSSRSTEEAGDAFPLFVDATPSTVKGFVPDNGESSGHRAILETLGTGVALFDYDLNGLWDLCLPGGGGFDQQPQVKGRPSALFRHEQAEVFEDVSERAGLKTDRLYSHAALPGDFNHDGFQDLLITGYGSVLLFYNNGDGTFDEVAQAANLENSEWSTAAAWGDLNSDGVLDLYLVNYVNWSFENNPQCFQGSHQEPCSPTRYRATSDRLFLGNGDGTFRDATHEAGLTSGGKGLGVAIADLDLDGDVDIYVANDTTPNFLYQNDGQAKLQEIGLQSGTALSNTAEADGSMGIGIGDLNQDGLPDIWVSNYEEQSNALYQNRGDNYFEHMSNQFGVAAVGTVYVGFGTVLFDFDSDSDEDLFVANGHIMLHAPNSPYEQQPLLFENRAGKRVVNVADHAGEYFQGAHVGRGVASSDLDNDGDLDLVITHICAPAVVLENQGKASGNWLRLKLIGVESNRDAIGARIQAVTSSGVQARQITGGGSFLSASDARIFLGLGTDTEVEQLSIIWPSGAEQNLKHIPANQTLTIIEQ